MQSLEFNSIIEEKGIIHIPEQFMLYVKYPVKITLITNEESKKDKKKIFSAISIKTKNFKFDRDEANAR
jgi:predicted nucleotide-binding protein (sugar kinase/HSP70/actin superfamily)